MPKNLNKIIILRKILRIIPPLIPLPPFSFFYSLFSFFCSLFTFFHISLSFALFFPFPFLFLSSPPSKFFPVFQFRPTFPPWPDYIPMRVAHKKFPWAVYNGPFPQFLSPDILSLIPVSPSFSLFFPFPFFIKSSLKILPCVSRGVATTTS